ncbi:uncharacterized protein LOC112056916 [Bicyclus anynana]|uniref:Uncharacterized protein LOC112056916 n=1 Tax=Bicyclus anynana TaxID=110368 RepID=A0ABM3M806_BICAN|nr:uncharacterized protein LOC112056916 [Bicyclus anynana]
MQPQNKTASSHEESVPGGHVIKGCLVPGYDELVPIGTFVPSKTACAEIRCETNGSTSAALCPRVSVKSPPCSVEIYQSLPYPECCPRANCPTDHKTLSQ